jgi:hypothetical protein
MAGIEMTPAILKKYCKENGLYSTPSINDKIYLHYKGFRSIQSLEEYTGLKCLWLEGNGLSKIEGLEKQTILRTLFLQENILEKIENLDAQTELDTLNLSKNYIKKIENLSHMKKLTSLNMASNNIVTAADIQELTELDSLQTIDLQHNKITDVDILDILSSLKDLRVLYLIGNPVIKNIRHYRKTVIAKCKTLRYLDDRPVFDDERRRVEAWMAVFEVDGSIDAANEAERLELVKIRKEKDDIDDKNFKAFENLMKSGQEIKRKREQALLDGIDPETIVRESNINPFSGETIIDVPESPSLKEARERRWGTVSAPSELVDEAPPIPQVQEVLSQANISTSTGKVNNSSSIWAETEIEENPVAVEDEVLPVPEVSEGLPEPNLNSNEFNEDPSTNKEPLDSGSTWTKMKIEDESEESPAPLASTIEPRSEPLSESVLEPLTDALDNTVVKKKGFFSSVGGLAKQFKQGLGFSKPSISKSTESSVCDNVSDSVPESVPESLSESLSITQIPDSISTAKESLPPPSTESSLPLADSSSQEILPPPPPTTSQLSPTSELPIPPIPTQKDGQDETDPAELD